MEKSSELSVDDLEATNTSTVEESDSFLRRKKLIAVVGDIDVAICKSLVIRQDDFFSC